MQAKWMISYFIHDPLVIAATLPLTLAYLTHGAWWGSGIAIALSFAIAQVFWLVVERPIHRLSQRIARRQPLFSRRVEPTSSTTRTPQFP